MSSCSHARFSASSSSSPPPPQHTGELCLLRKPGTFGDLLVELRAIDNSFNVAVVRIGDKLERVPLCYLRRAA
jgi:hypothetical protein